MSHTIPELTTEANDLYAALAADLNINFALPDITLPTDFDMPPETGPAYETLAPVTLEQLTTGTVNGTGVFDALMRTVAAQLATQYEAGRLTGADYAKVFSGSIAAVMQFGTQFVLSKDRAQLENLQLQEAVKLAQAQRIRALADIQVARGQVQQMAYEAINSRLKAYTGRNEYALSKMQLVTGYNGVLRSESEMRLVNEQVETQRAQTWDTHLDGTPILGLMGKQIELADAQMLTQREELDTARSKTKDTLVDGQPVRGLVALEKATQEAAMVHMEEQGRLVREQVEVAHAQVADLKTDGMTPIGGLLAVEKTLKVSQERLVNEQYEGQRAQVRDTLSNGSTVGGLLGVEKEVKQAQKKLVNEQAESQRAQTWDLHFDGTPITGIAKYEKDLKAAQSKLVLEQYESQRGQTRGTLSTGEVVVGLIGTQTRLYEQQIVSYKRDAESKGIKILLDTWVARKTIDDGVVVPSAIDGTSLNSAITSFTSNLEL